MMPSLQCKGQVKLGFFRGADLSTSVGQTDWRIALYMPELVGFGPAESRLSRLASDLGVSEHAGFPPPIPHFEMPALVAAADLGINPWPDQPWWRHQSLLKVYEYLAAGKPVLATALPCHQDTSEAVLLTRDSAPATLAAAIESYRNLPAREKRCLREAALRQVQPYTWRARAAVLADFIINEVLVG